MYCKFCGKYTNETDAVCAECKSRTAKNAAPQNFSCGQSYGGAGYNGGAPQFGGTMPPVNARQPQSPYGKMYGFGPALAAAICGCIGGLVLIYGGAAILAFLPAYMLSSDTLLTLQITYIFMIVTGFVLGIIALALGINGVRKFSTAKRNGGKPIATLVLGIVGLAAGAVTMLLGLIMLIVVVPSMFV